MMVTHHVGFNDILAKRCSDLGFHLVSNSNIELCDLSDGLHVNNRVGHAKLKHNIMKCCDTYIHKNRRYDAQIGDIIISDTPVLGDENFLNLTK